MSTKKYFFFFVRCIDDIKFYIDLYFQGYLLDADRRLNAESGSTPTPSPASLRRGDETPSTHSFSSSSATPSAHLTVPTPHGLSAQHIGSSGPHGGNALRNSHVPQSQDSFEDEFSDDGTCTALYHFTRKSHLLLSISLWIW